jgi:pilus assembly protein Flp/PilA
MIVETQISKDALLRKDEGQGMVEYGLIIALVSVVVIGVLGFMGGNLIAKFQEIVDALA